MDRETALLINESIKKTYAIRKSLLETQRLQDIKNVAMLSKFHDTLMAKIASGESYDPKEVIQFFIDFSDIVRQNEQLYFDSIGLVDDLYLFERARMHADLHGIPDVNKWNTINT